MLNLLATKLSRTPRRFCHVQQRDYKVAVVGAAGGIGQPLALLLKQNPMICELSLHDLRNVKGVAMDLSHICTSPRVKGIEGKQKALIEAIKDADIVVVPAGLPRKPGMDRQQLLDANASVVVSVTEAVSVACPKALVAIITNPVNTLVPIAAEIMITKGIFDPNRLFGVTCLDVVRARAFIAEHMGVDPATVDVPVIGGHSNVTMLPIFSQCNPKLQANEEKIKTLTKRVQEAGTEVVEAKAGGGSATLSMAYAAAEFTNALVCGLQGDPNVLQYAYVASSVTELPFFASQLKLGPKGIDKYMPLPQMNADEQKLFKKILPVLEKDIAAGCKFAADYKKSQGKCNKKK